MSGVPSVRRGLRFSPSDDPSAVMFVGYSGSRRELRESDISSARELYPIT